MEANNSIISGRLTLLRSLIVMGLVLFALAVVVSNSNLLQTIFPLETVELECVIGSEKSGFLDNETVQGILAEDYGISVSYRRMGSIEQVMLDPAVLDCLWPSNTSVLEIFQEEHPDYAQTAQSEIIFNSPIVLYSWQPVVDVLITRGMIREETNGILTIDSFRLVESLTAEERAQWSELGIVDLFGTFNVVTTDPLRSNSGNMFYALMANVMNGGDVASAETIEQYLPAIADYYNRQGRLEESSGILFEQFARLGIGQYPIIANYENLLIEFSVENPDDIEQIIQEIRIIYLSPTVWSSHPLIALTDNGQVLLEALQDERLQDIAWEQHGFRSGLAGAQNDPSTLGIVGIAPTVSSVIALPRSDAILVLLDYLQN